MHDFKENYEAVQVDESIYNADATHIKLLKIIYFLGQKNKSAKVLINILMAAFHVSCMNNCVFQEDRIPDLVSDTDSLLGYVFGSQLFLW